ncbi:hypothetical protein ACSBR1_013062 [Camellia fascicularis]
MLIQGVDKTSQTLSIAGKGNRRQAKYGSQLAIKPPRYFSTQGESDIYPSRSNRFSLCFSVSLLQVVGVRQNS